jgi:hypothetical protein
MQVTRIVTSALRAQGREMTIAKATATLAAFVVLALVCAMSALADAPTSSSTSLRLAFVDSSSCSFPIDVTVDLARRTETFSDGDATRHATLAVTQTANGHSDVETDSFDVFISASDPTNWKITGRFGQVRVDGKLIYVQSGLIAYDPLTDTLSDPHPGPLGGFPDPCAALAL